MYEYKSKQQECRAGAYKTCSERLVCSVTSLFRNGVKFSHPYFSLHVYHYNTGTNLSECLVLYVFFPQYL
jgi:hypothetical protein